MITIISNLLFRISPLNRRFIDKYLVSIMGRTAQLLINARNPASPFTKYSFPSKTFEYLYSGTPFISTKLEGIPEEYNKYLYLISDNNPKTIAEKVMEILNTDVAVLDDRALKAKEFIKSKGYCQQSKKLLDFLKSECYKGPES